MKISYSPLHSLLKPIKYPRLMTNKYNHLYYQFHSDRCILIDMNGNSKGNGTFNEVIDCTNWTEDNLWKPFDGEITLSND